MAKYTNVMSRWNVVMNEEEELSGDGAVVGAGVDSRCVMGDLVCLDWGEFVGLRKSDNWIWSKELQMNSLPLAGQFFDNK